MTNINIKIIQLGPILLNELYFNNQTRRGSYRKKCFTFRSHLPYFHTKIIDGVKFVNYFVNSRPSCVWLFSLYCKT